MSSSYFEFALFWYSGETSLVHGIDYAEHVSPTVHGLDRDGFVSLCFYALPLRQPSPPTSDLESISRLPFRFSGYPPTLCFMHQRPSVTMFGW